MVSDRLEGCFGGVSGEIKFEDDDGLMRTSMRDTVRGASRTGWGLRDVGTTTTALFWGTVASRSSAASIASLFSVLERAMMWSKER